MGRELSSRPETKHRTPRSNVFVRFRIPLLYRYIFWEIVTPFAVSLSVFTGVLFLARSIKLFDLVVNRSVPLGDMILLFAYLIPRFLEIAVPMSGLLGIILAFGRLSAESELVVMRSAGISMRQLAAPVLTFALIASLASVVIASWLRPWANRQLAIGLFEVAKVQASAGLTQGVFQELGNLTMYAEKVLPDGRMQNVIIAERSDTAAQKTFISNVGQMVSNDQSRTLHLRLYDGVLQEGSAQNATLTYFDMNTIRLNAEDLSSQSEEDDKDLKSSELLMGDLVSETKRLEAIDPQTEEIQRDILHKRVEFHRRLSVSFACLCVALAALSLGIQPSRGGRTWGMAINIGFGILMIVLYYLLLGLCAAAAENHFAPPAVALWFPNFATASVGFWLFHRLEQEHALTLWPIGQRWVWKFMRKQKPTGAA